MSSNLNWLEIQIICHELNIWHVKKLDEIDIEELSINNWEEA